ncbi:MAG: ATP-binding cassette domain-containing protein [Prevotellaceae bacterium]|jgi:ABC-type lipoprotein export system ATPase subunit|nr:ATP-binding cassette domain-containing protein [Prevotellaceae bacterium]
MDRLRINNLKPFFLSGGGDVPAAGEIWFCDVSFRKGENYLISASSGQGKSSLLSFIFGERADYQGDIYFDDKEIKTLKKTEWQDVRKKNISCVFQGLRLFSELTALENIQLKNKIIEYKSQEEISYLIEKSGLQDKMNEKAGRLSFGQQQRVATLRALCQPFDFILLDEPFSHLDEQNIEVMTELISSELNSRNAGMLLCSLGYEYPFDYHHKYII